MKNIPLVECWNFVGSTPQKFDGEKRYISTGALDKDHINEADVEMVTFDNRPSRANLEVNSGDILFAKMASTEKTFVVDSISQNDIYSTGFCAVRANESKILSKCLYYFLSSSLFLEQKDKNSSGATQKAITNAGLSKIYINLPELAEQQEFIEQMDSLTSLITARREQLAKLDELVKSRFVELFGDTPDGEKVAMADICRIITDGTHQPPKFVSEGIPFLFVSNIVTNEIRYDAQKFISEETYAELIKRTPIAIGDILLSTVGSYGHPAVVKTEKPFCFQRHIAYLKPNADIVDSEYLRGAILSADVQRQIDEGVKGIAQKTLNLSEIRKIRLPLPPIESQKRFAAFVEQTDKSKFEIQKSLEKLETLKKALMQKYFG